MTDEMMKFQVGDLVKLSDEFIDGYKRHSYDEDQVTAAIKGIGVCLGYYSPTKEEIIELLRHTNTGSPACGPIEKAYYWCSDYFYENDDARIDELTPEIEKEILESYKKKYQGIRIKWCSPMPLLPNAGLDPEDLIKVEGGQ